MGMGLMSLDDGLGTDSRESPGRCEQAGRLSLDDEGRTGPWVRVGTTPPDSVFSTMAEYLEWR